MVRNTAGLIGVEGATLSSVAAKVHAAGGSRGTA